MTYEAQWKLTYDDAFVSRCRACITQESDRLLTDERLDMVACAEALLRNSNPAIWSTFQSLMGAAPGLADKADNGDGTVDSTRITDAEVLSNVQAEYSQVAGLYFTTDGAPAP
jgi:hypothetical protein